MLNYQDNFLFFNKFLTLNKERYLLKKKHYFSKDDKSLDLYLREIGETPLLSEVQEKELPKRIRQGDQSALDWMTRANLRFVVTVAKQYQNQGMLLSDLINEGNIGLIKSCWRFDETRGFKFISYSVWWIRQAILQALAEQSRIVRLPINRVGILHKIGKISAGLEQDYGREPTAKEIAEVMELTELEITETMKIESIHLSLDTPFSENSNEPNTLLNVLEDEDAGMPDQNMFDDELSNEIKKALDSLTPREAEVINLYFGLKNEKPLTLEEIGARFSLTRERVRQIKVKAIKRLRHVSRSKILRDFLHE